MSDYADPVFDQIRSKIFSDSVNKFIDDSTCCADPECPTTNYLVIPQTVVCLSRLFTMRLGSGESESMAVVRQFSRGKCVASFVDGSKCGAKSVAEFRGKVLEKAAEKLIEDRDGVTVTWVFVTAINAKELNAPTDTHPVAHHCPKFRLDRNDRKMIEESYEKHSPKNRSEDVFSVMVVHEDASSQFPVRTFSSPLATVVGKENSDENLIAAGVRKEDITEDMWFYTTVGHVKENRRGSMVVYDAELHGPIIIE
jgi:hypothetical protein